VTAREPARGVRPLLQVENLTKSFGGVLAVDHLDLAVAPGELRCLIGPNGAGKSTLFSLLSGLHRSDAGRILFKGEDITRMQPQYRVRKGLCLKFQTTRVYRGMSVAQNLLIAGGGRLDGNNSARLEWALASLHLDAELDVPAALLPHSHQQWLEICLALATLPELLLLDEPTAGMTPEETSVTARFLIDLNCRGLAMLVVEHDMAFVRQIGRNVTVLHYGRIFSEGTLDEIEASREVRQIYLGEH
jgi:branched-chain amino acid transport system ATP-binding protein